ncbi:hypothetical protein [Rhodopila sp.]|jgi:hypothetical protein|uniref:hypothetical protein n=1 Tax=Rhodopila sp. TaxID=2480087 RepID=UPI002BBD9667|nr:hypothetical protein [Rhodopila sp.]HVZ08184.1 hypothetical protein [Rhodopila sp.]
MKNARLLLSSLAPFGLAPFGLAVLGSAVPASAQVALGPDCRPLPVPGYMMQPQPPDPSCLAAQARAAEAYRRRQAAEAEAARKRAEAKAAADQERLAQEESQCAATTPDDVRATLEQDPGSHGLRSKILDVAAPHFTANACRTEVMTSTGVMLGQIRFRDFNGKTYLLIHLQPDKRS